MKTYRILGALVLSGFLSLATSQAAFNLYGNSNDLGGSSNISAHFLLGSMVTLDQTVDLLDAGVIFRNAGYNANIGLYSADFSNGLPDQLLATTGSFFVTSTGTVETPFTTSPTLLPGDYWFMAEYDRDSVSVGFSQTVTNLVAYRSLTFATSLPSAFGPASTYTGQAFNYYLVTQSVPEPSTYALFGLGALALVIAATRRIQKA